MELGWCGLPSRHLLPKYATTSFVRLGLAIAHTPRLLDSKPSLHRPNSGSQVPRKNVDFPLG